MVLDVKLTFLLFSRLDSEACIIKDVGYHTEQYVEDAAGSVSAKLVR